MNYFTLTIKWLAAIFTEPDGNGGKASFARVSGAYVIWQIIELARVNKSVPEALMTLFWVLVGYQFLSKALNSLTPALADVAKSILLRTLGSNSELPKVA